MAASTRLHCVILATSLLSVPVAIAQQQSPQQQSPSSPSTAAPDTSSPSTPSADLSDQKLDAAAAAVKGVSALRDIYEQKFSAAPPAERDRVAEEADGAMKKAITDQGLSIAEYSAILQVAKNDPVVRDKLMQRLK